MCACLSWCRCTASRKEGNHFGLVNADFPHTLSKWSTMYWLYICMVWNYTSIQMIFRNLMGGGISVCNPTVNIMGLLIDFSDYQWLKHCTFVISCFKLNAINYKLLFILYKYWRLKGPEMEHIKFVNFDLPLLQYTPTKHICKQFGINFFFVRERKETHCSWKGTDTILFK